MKGAFRLDWLVLPGILLIWASGMSAQVQIPIFGKELPVLLSRSQVQELGAYPIAFDDRVTEIRFSDDGASIDVVSDHIARLNWRTGETEGILWWPREGETLSHAVFSPDGRTFARLENGPRAYIHDADTGKVLQAFGGASRMAWGAASKSLACGGKGMVIVRDVASGAQLARIAAGRNEISALAISPDGTRIAAGDKDRDGIEGLLGIYRLDGEAAPVRLEGGTGWSNRSALFFSPDGTRVAGQSELKGRSRFRVWDVETGKVIHEFPGSYNHGAYSRDGRMLAACGLKNIQVWDADSGEELFGHQGEGVNEHLWALAFSPKGDVLATGVETRIKFWDTGTWMEINPSGSHSTPGISLAFTPDGKRLLTGSLGGRLICWDWQKKSILWKNDENTESWGIRVISTGPDGKRAGVTSPPFVRQEAQVFQVYDLEAGSRTRSFGGRYSSDSMIAFSRDGEMAYTRGMEGSVAEWDVLTGALKRRIGSRPLEAPGQSAMVVQTIALPPESEDAIWWCGDYQGLGLRRLSDGKDLRMLEGGSHHGNARVQLSPDGDFLTVGNRIWSLPRGEIIHDGHSHRNQMAHYPRGRLLALPKGRFAEIFDVLSRKIIHEIDFGPGEIRAMAFSPDGKTLVAAGDGGVKYVDFRRLLDRRGLEGAEPGLLWTMMGEGDAWLAWQATWELASREEMVPFLDDALQPVGQPEEVERRLLRNLMRDADPVVRLIAARQLNDRGVTLTEAELESLRPISIQRAGFALNHGGPIDPIPGLDYPRQAGPVPALRPLSQRLRSSRAVLLLEENGSREAIVLLQKLAAGYQPSPLTKEAQRALARLDVNQ